MTRYEADESGAPLCVDCATGQCRPVDGWRCQAEHCQCLCRVDSWPDDATRAVELDDRPDAALDSLARDIEHETRPAALDLHAERFGDHRTLAAERGRRRAA